MFSSLGNSFGVATLHDNGPVDLEQIDFWPLLLRRLFSNGYFECRRSDVAHFPGRERQRDLLSGIGEALNPIFFLVVPNPRLRVPKRVSKIGRVRWRIVAICLLHA
jgi:hypothetical protein